MKKEKHGIFHKALDQKKFTKDILKIIIKFINTQKSLGFN